MPRQDKTLHANGLGPAPGPLSRRQVLKTGLGGAAAMLSGAPAVMAQSKRFSGVTLNISCWSAAYPKFLADYLPEFTEATGIKVNYETPGLPVYNQRADLELSTKGSAYDVLNITFVFASRWIGAGWLEPLDPFLKDPNKTPSEFDFADFLPGALDPLKDKAGLIYGVPWVTDACFSCAARTDILKSEGLSMPDTFEELEKTLSVVHNKQGVFGFLTDNHWGWWYPPILQAYGGSIFRNAPDDLNLTLDTPEAIFAAEYLARIVKTYGPEGAIGYNYDQVTEALRNGRANLTMATYATAAQVGEQSSKVANTVGYGLFPKGPKGRFPGLATHAWGIPVAAKNKDASWEFIKWAMSKQLLLRMANEKGISSILRKSVIEHPDYSKKMLINGYDTSKLFVETLKLGEQGYMKYRTVPVYPQVNVQLNQAIARIASGQMGAKESMKQAQQILLGDFKRAGVRL